jgi:hypothetical protein
MKLRIRGSAHDPRLMRVENAETGEVLQNVIGVRIELTMRENYAVLMIRDAEIDLEVIDPDVIHRDPLEQRRRD